MIDPPWPQRKGGRRTVRPNQARDLDYSTLSVKEIFDLLDREVFPLAEMPHIALVWTIDKFLRDCEREIERMSYRLHARLIWNKENGVAPAFSIRYAHEYLLWYYKPKFIPVDKDMRGKYMTVFSERSREHSRKPDIAYQMARDWWPNVSRLDVFSREKREGWDQWGNQIDHFN